MINRRITGALAWGGLLLVIGVPSADLILRNFSGAEASTEVETASVAEKPAVVAKPAPKAPVAQQPAAKPLPKATPAPKAAPAPKTDPVVTASAKPSGSGDAVDQFLSRGKKLPDYISGGDSGAATPAATPKPAPAPAEETVATVPELVAPVPMPASMRPKSRAVVIEAQRPAVNPRPGTPVPPAEVSGAELDDWDSGSLADYLARKGLLGGQEGDGAYFVDERF